MRLNQPLGGKGSRKVFVSDTLYQIDADGELTPKPDFCLMNKKAIDKLRADLDAAQADAALTQDTLAGATEARRRAFWSGLMLGGFAVGAVALVLLAFAWGVF